MFNRFNAEENGRNEPCRLIAVIQTDDPATPIPPRSAYIRRPFAKTKENLNRTDDGQTELCIRFDAKSEWNDRQDAIESECSYELTAKNKLYGEKYFRVIDIEHTFTADYMPYSDDRYLGFTRGHILSIGQDYARDRIIDLAKWSTDKDKFLADGSSRVRFALPGGLELYNTKSGVNIGGFTFNDVFEQFRPLWNSDIIPCRHHNYKLIFHYGVRW